MTHTHHQSLSRLLEQLCAEDMSPLAALRELVCTLRPFEPKLFEQAQMNVQALCYLLEHRPDYRQALRAAILQLLTETRQVALYTEAGILSSEDFSTALTRRIGERLLPMPAQENSLRDAFGQIFDQPHDHIWLAGVPEESWCALWRALAWREMDTAPGQRQTRLQLLEAVQVLAARVTAIGLEPELVRLHPDIERFESPFLRLSAEVLHFVDSQRQALVDNAVVAEDDKQVLVLLDQCDEILGKVRRNASRYGISVDLTYRALRMEQIMLRMRALLALLEPEHDPGTSPVLFRLLVEFVRAENRKYSLRDLSKGNTELLALQVTEHAGRHGEHYIAETRTEWSSMARAAMGAGFIVGFMALIKLLLARGHLPLLLEGVAFGLNYALGFMLIHMLHCTVATKQPAMTAARIAAVLHQQSGRKRQLDELADLIVKVARTQFVAIVGNVLLAVPTAAAIAWGWQQAFGVPVVDTAKAGKLLGEIDPVHSLALFYASIAGVYLFLSGLISGYYDNKAIYRRIPERVAALPWLRRLAGEARARRVGQYLEQHLGALAGNFYFGMFLGLTGTVGTMLGLPLDIRHITFSSANLAFATVALDFQVPLSVVLWGALGVALIGFFNLAVSFVFALWVALRSRKLSGRDMLPLIPLLLRRFVRQPLPFFVPPASSSGEGNAAHRGS